LPNPVTAEYVEEIAKKSFIIPHLVLSFNLGEKLPQMHQAIHYRMNLINELLEVESANRIEFHFIIAISFLFVDGTGRALSRDFRESWSDFCANRSWFNIWSAQ
jgi:hypothetical protein